MQDLAIPSPVPSRRSGGGRWFAVVLAAIVLAGLAAAGWLGWQRGWRLDLAGPAPVTAPSLASASPSATALETRARLAATDAAIASAAARVSALEQRLAEINQQAIAASGQASHAEALLIAFAARRAIERGQPLGYLENQLRVRFGQNQPGAVDRVVAAGRKPTTLAGLSEDFVRLEPRLVGGAPGEDGWAWLTRQMGELFVIRHDDLPSPAPESRASRARAALAGGRIDAAIAEVERMPGRDAATDWLARARDLAMTNNALDQLETAALAMPVAPPAVAASSAPIAPGAGPDARPPAPAPALSPAPQRPAQP